MLVVLSPPVIQGMLDRHANLCDTNQDFDSADQVTIYRRNCECAESM